MSMNLDPSTRIGNLPPNIFLHLRIQKKMDDAYGEDNQKVEWPTYVKYFNKDTAGSIAGSDNVTLRDTWTSFVDGRSDGFLYTTIQLWKDGQLHNPDGGELGKFIVVTCDEAPPRLVPAIDSAGAIENPTNNAEIYLHVLSDVESQTLADLIARAETILPEPHRPTPSTGL
jgi:hypothetical protein